MLSLLHMYDTDAHVAYNIIVNLFLIVNFQIPFIIKKKKKTLILYISRV